MSALILSLISSLLVGFYIKYLKISTKRELFVFVFSNYVMASFLTYYLFELSISTIKFSIFDYKLVIFVSFLLPTVFYFLHKSLEFSGLAKTDIFQRLSLIIPIIFSFFLFNEEFSYIKAFVIVLTFISIFLILGKNSNNNLNKNHTNIFYLIAVFLGYGFVDTMFKLIATNKDINFVELLFVIFVISAFISLLYISFFKGKIDFKYLFFGLILGVLNFSNIYFYIKAHKIFAQTPTLVFITMNLGVIIGGVIIGKYYFKEYLSKQAVLGILLAIVCIVLLALIQLKI
ncbi:EamA family transporter [Arcobacter vandammei]|uniref:EamA family transporter n=1 Tax=Arcobacter vandammei TaxID=2782243 RepID=UPI0018E00E0F|nr:EamA family transporter [Arcobacter vandammei]